MPGQQSQGVPAASESPISHEVHSVGPCIASWHKARARQQRRMDPRYLTLTLLTLTLLTRLLPHCLSICGPWSPSCRPAVRGSESERERARCAVCGCPHNVVSCRVVWCVGSLPSCRSTSLSPPPTAHYLAFRPFPGRAYCARHLAAVV